MNFYIVTANTSFEWKSNSVEPPCPPSTKQTVLSWTGSTEHWSQLTDDSEQLRSSHNPSIRVFESPSTRVSNYLTIQVSEYLSGLWATEEFSRTRSAGFPLAVSYCPIIRVSEYSSVQLSHNLSIRVFEHPSISQSEHPSGRGATDELSWTRSTGFPLIALFAQTKPSSRNQNTSITITKNYENANSNILTKTITITMSITLSVPIPITESEYFQAGVTLVSNIGKPHNNDFLIWIMPYSPTLSKRTTGVTLYFFFWYIFTPITV